MPDASTPADSLDDSRARDLQPPTDSGRRQWDRAAWLAAYEEKGTVTAACKVVRISRQTAYQERKLNAPFAEAWDRAEQAVTDVLEKTAVERALDGSDRLMEFLLKGRRPQTYRESVNVKHGGKVGVEVEEGVDDAITGALAEVERLTERLAELESGREAQVPGGTESADMARGS